MKVSTVTFKVPRERVPDPDSNDWVREAAYSALGEEAHRSSGSEAHRSSGSEAHRSSGSEAHRSSRAALHLLWGWGSGLVPLGEGRGATQGQQRRWLGSNRWQRRIRRVLRGSGLNFSQWLILDATAALIATTGDAVSQGDVAGYVELSRMAVSRAMIALDAKGLVSRGGPMSGPAWRIFMNEEGMNLLRDLAGAIESVSGPC